MSTETKFSNADIMKLRQRTSAGMMDCRNALLETDGNLEKAAEWLREKGIAAAAKKADRIAAEGLVQSYIHMGGKIGVLVEVNCETDFVAKSDSFVELCKNIALQIAASKPEYITVEEVPAEVIEEEKNVLRQQAKNEGKKDDIIEKMIEGRIKKFYKDVCLLEQDYVKDTDKTIQEVVTDAILTIGEKISIRRFARFEMGEGLEKRSENLAEEIQKQMG